MKKITALLLVLLVCISCAALAETETALSGNAQLVYETVKWAQDMPKTARVISAQEYMSKLSETVTAHYMMIYVTQTDFNMNHFGTCSQLILLNMDTDEVWTYTNVDLSVLPEEPAPENAHLLLFNSFDSYVMGYNEYIWWDGDIITPVSEDEILQINAALDAYFVR